MRRPSGEVIDGRPTPNDLTLAFRPELAGIPITRPLALPALLELLRRGELHPDATPDEVRAEALPATREEAEVEIAYVEAILAGAFIAQHEASLIVAYRARLRALRGWVEGVRAGKAVGLAALGREG